MNSETEKRSCLPGAVNLEFMHTVDRSLLHHWALSEIFLTDGRKVGDDEYLAAAQLPPSHAYYTEHTSRLGAPAPMLLPDLRTFYIEFEQQGDVIAAGRMHTTTRAWAHTIPGGRECL